MRVGVRGLGCQVFEPAHPNLLADGEPARRVEVVEDVVPTDHEAIHEGGERDAELVDELDRGSVLRSSGPVSGRAAAG